MAKKEALSQFFVGVRVVLDEPFSADGDSARKIAGYYINLGVNACDLEEATLLVEDHITDGTIDWADSEWRAIDDLHAEIREKAENARDAGIWYQSGRMFF